MKIILFILSFSLLAGCTTSSKSPPKQGQPLNISRNVSPAGTDIYSRAPEVVRYDRYRLVSTSPLSVQRDPLSQLVDIHIPGSLKPTVSDALQYLLKQSGFSLCQQNAQNDILFRQPLPSVHYKLGPVRLRTALQVIAGPAWQLEVNEVERTVCYSLQEGYQQPMKVAAAEVSHEVHNEG